MNGIPRELDWVRERAACSLAKVFSNLHRGVEEDVKVANSVCPTSPRRTLFEVHTDKNDAFTVQRAESIRPVVVFMLQSECILVSVGPGNEEWRFTVGLNNEGRCLLRFDGKEFEHWQVRKMALEGLFFDS
jgi:hypothetical protein